MKTKFLGHSANDLFWFILPLVLPSLLVRYDLNFTQAGSIITMYLLFTAAGAFIIGKLSDRVSRKNILSFGFFISAAGLILSSFAPGLALFLVFISITALGMSSFHPVMYALIDESCSGISKNRIMGYYEFFGTAAILLMFLINGFLLERIDVRGVLIVTAVPAIVMGVIYFFTSALDTVPETEAVKAEMPGERYAEKTSKSRFIIFLLSIILRVVAVTALLNFLPTIFVEFFGFPHDKASYATALFFAGGLSGSLIAGKLANRFNSFGIILGGTVIIGITLIILSLELPAWLYLVIVVFFGASGSGCIINQNLLISRLSGSLGKGEVFGILMGVMTVTSALSPGFFGIVLDHLGYRTALQLFTTPLVLSIILLSYLLKTDSFNQKSVEKISL